MDAGRDDPVERLDRAGDLAFERAQVIDVLDEARRREAVALVEDLPADAAARRQALLGEAHAELRDVVLRHHDAGAVTFKLVGDVLALELLHHRGGVLRREVGEERNHRGRGEADDDEGEEADEGERHHAHRRDTAGAERLQELTQSCHRSTLEAAGRCVQTARQELPGAW